MRPTLIHAALDALDAPHRAGHRCTDGEWWNDAVGTRTSCGVRGHIATIRTQVERLHASVHDAAHSDDAVTAVLTGMTGFSTEDLAAMPAEDRDGWVLTVRLAVEALAEWLDRDPVKDARVAAVRERLAAAQKPETRDCYHGPDCHGSGPDCYPEDA